MARIIIPAWGKRCIDCALSLAIPSALAACKYAHEPAELVIYTENPAAFGTLPAEFRPLPPGAYNLQVVTVIYCEALGAAQPGALLTFMNADLVISVETFAVARKVLRDHCKVMATCGVRTLDHDLAPIGVGARELLAWAWAHKHTLVDGCIWQRGDSDMPITLYFERDGNVVLHCSHIHPIIVRKDDRDNLQFRGTIDDGFLENYQPHEIFYPCDAEFAVVESSPEGYGYDGRHPRNKRVINDGVVVAYARTKFMRSQLHSFRQPLRIVGDGDAGDGVLASLLPRQ